MSGQYPPQGPPPPPGPPQGPPSGPAQGPPPQGPHEYGQPTPESGGGGRGPSKGVIAAIVLGVLVVVGGVVTASILLLGGDDDSGEGSDPEPTAETATEPVCEDGDESGCTPPTEEPTEEPTDEPTEPTEEPTEEPTAEPADGDPAAAVQGFVDAVKANDCPTAISYLSEGMVKEEDANCKDFDVSGLEDVEYGTPYVVDAVDDSATVEQTVSIPQAQQDVTLSYDLVYDGSRWLIDGFDDTSSGQ